MKFEPGDRVKPTVAVVIEWVSEKKKFFSVVAADYQKHHVSAGTSLTVVSQTEKRHCYYLDTSHLGIVVEGEPITEVGYWGGFLEPVSPLVQLAEASDS